MFYAQLFCMAIVGATAYNAAAETHLLGSTTVTPGNTPWNSWRKEKRLTDDAPVLICSDLPESNDLHMPVGSAVKDSVLFAPAHLLQTQRAESWG